MSSRKYYLLEPWKEKLHSLPGSRVGVSYLRKEAWMWGHQIILSTVTHQQMQWSTMAEIITAVQNANVKKAYLTFVGSFFSLPAAEFPVLLERQNLSSNYHEPLSVFSKARLGSMRTLASSAVSRNVMMRCCNYTMQTFQMRQWDISFQHKLPLGAGLLSGLAKAAEVPCSKQLCMKSTIRWLMGLMPT